MGPGPQRRTSDGSTCARGMIRSNEMSGDNAMLISLHAQSSLGFVKDTQRGTCYIRHVWGPCPGGTELVEITLYNLRGNGLRTICISTFPSGASIQHVEQPTARWTVAKPSVP